MTLYKHRRSFLGFAMFAALWVTATLPAKQTPAIQPASLAFNPPGGIFTRAVNLQLTSSLTEATIRYTLDGSEPGEDSPVYSQPLLIEANTLVRARAFAGRNASAPAAQVYTVLDDDVASFTSNLPLVLLNSFGTNIVHERNTLGAIQVVEGGKERAKLSGQPVLGSSCWVHLRGRASLRYPKRSYTVKLTNAEGDPEARQMLGMPAESDWVLYAPYPDKTLIRDILAYELHSKMGYWAPRWRFVEVFVNTSGRKITRRDYMGVFVVEEKIKRDKNRIDIAKLKPEDSSEPRITGGYIFKKDHIGAIDYAINGDPLGGFPGNGGGSSSSRSGYPTGPGGFPADPKGFQKPRIVTRSSSSSSSRSSSSSSSSRVITNYFGLPPRLEMASSSRTTIAREDEEEEFMKAEARMKTSQTNEFFFVEPEPDEITPVQKDWLRNHLNQLEAALYGAEFRDPAKGYAAYIDVDSFIDYHIIVEATKNVDGFRFSNFFYKDRGEKIRNAPIWDWNLSFGNANGKQGWLAEYWLWPQLDNKEYTWFRRLFEDPDFGQRYVDRWAQLRTNVLATANVLARVDELTSLLQESQKRNFERWPILGRNVNPNYFVGSSYEEEVNFLKKFIQTRLDWISRQFPTTPGVTSANARKLELAGGAEGQIYFTIDGSDPRASGGNPSAAAKTYSGPVELPQGARLQARLRQDNRWSAPLQFQLP